MKYKNNLKKITAGIILVIFTCGCSMKAHIHESYGHENENKLNYEVPFEEGYILNKNGKIRMILAFYKSGKFYQGTDSNQHLRYYIYSTDQIIHEKNSTPITTEAFFIRVLTHIFTGDVKIENIELNTAGKNIFKLSADLKAESIYMEGIDGPSNSKITISFKDLPLKIVESYEELSTHFDKFDLYKMNE